jgi:hypothetical protein
MGAWRSARAKLILAVPLFLVILVVIILAVRVSAPSSTVAAPTRHSPSKVVSVVPSYHPLRIEPPQTAIERTVNQGFARLWRGESAATAAKLPSAATSTIYPPIDATNSLAPSTYALAFTQELLDIDFASSTRHELLAWASFNDAPNSTVTMPVAINLKVLPASLTMNPTPIPTSTQWKKLAASRTSWRVSGLVTSVSPIWTELLATGWQPVDPLMTMYDVSGTLTVTAPGHGSDVESFFFLLTLGGASWHPGYGAVVMNNWTVN